MQSASSSKDPRATHRLRSFGCRRHCRSPEMLKGGADDGEQAPTMARGVGRYVDKIKEGDHESEDAARPDPATDSSLMH